MVMLTRDTRGNNNIRRHRLIWHPNVNPVNESGKQGVWVFAHDKSSDRRYLYLSKRSYTSPYWQNRIVETTKQN